MTRPRVEVHRLRELIRLRRLGSSGREVVRLLRMSPKTERRYRAALEAAGLLRGSPTTLPTLEEIRSAVQTALPPPAPPRSSVEPWREQVRALLEKGLTARAVYDRIKLRSNGSEAFRGSYSAVRRFVRRLQRERGARPEDVAIPVVALPGEEAQVDFGYAGRLYDPSTGVVRRAWVFVMVLGFSRLMFARLVFDQKVETWLDLHEQAFRAFGGSVATVVPDNTKRAVLRAAFGIAGPTELERSYRELAERYRFKIDPAPPGSPRKRGKVEATVKYLRNNPLKGRDGEAIDVVQADLDCWNREVASVRVHGTTGRRPLDAFERDERPALTPLPDAPGDRAIWKRAKVHPDSHITCRSRLFSVPWRLIHRHVWVRACGQVVEVFHEDRLVVRHTDTGLRRTTLDEHLPRDRRLLRYRSRCFWEARARRIGPETTALVRAVFDQDDVLSHLRQVQAIVKHLGEFPPARAEHASRLALRAGDLTYRGIKRTLTEALDVRGTSEATGEGETVVCRSCGGGAGQDHVVYRPRALSCRALQPARR